MNGLGLSYDAMKHEVCVRTRTAELPLNYYKGALPIQLGCEFGGGETMETTESRTACQSQDSDGLPCCYMSLKSCS